ncbi:hypothetical protein F5Y10DRAFT_235532 [Nemania abortiva]|nr:hypothetical protein F5Y10DRAFT_235532 [Nemania abortiva]
MEENSIRGLAGKMMAHWRLWLLTEKIVLAFFSIFFYPSLIYLGSIVLSFNVAYFIHFMCTSNNTNDRLLTGVSLTCYMVCPISGSYCPLRCFSIRGAGRQVLKGYRGFSI